MMTLTIDNTIKHYIAKYNLETVLNDRLLDALQLFQFPIYSHVCVEGAEQHYLYLLVDGQVQCSHYHLNGKLAVIALSNPLEAIGDLEIFDERVLRSNVIATEKTTMLAIPKHVVQAYGANDPQFLHFLLDQYRGKIYRSNALQMNQVLPLINRLSLYMLSQIEDGKTSLILPTKEELASLMGTTSRHLNRVIRQLVDTETISGSYPMVHILNRGELEQLAQS